MRGVCLRVAVLAAVCAVSLPAFGEKRVILSGSGPAAANAKTDRAAGKKAGSKKASKKATAKQRSRGSKASKKRATGKASKKTRQASKKAKPDVGPRRGSGSRKVAGKKASKKAASKKKKVAAKRDASKKKTAKKAAPKRAAHQKGRAPRKPKPTMPAGVEKPTPNAEARRQVAGGPTADDLAAGRDDPELRALSEADRVLFPKPLVGATSGWSWDLPKPTSKKRPAVVASGVPPEQRLESARPSRDRAARDADWLRSLTMPNLPVRLDPRVVKYLKFYRDNRRGRAIAKAWAKKSGRYAPAIKAALANAGLPTDLVWLSLIESGHNPSIHSHAGAAGLWQFIPEAGRLYGLNVDRWVDERLDPERSTQAAIRYLGDLNRRFGNWDLAMAAYNMGYGGLSRAIRKFNTNDFWELSRHEAGIPWETTLYVPKILAMAVVMNNKKAFGIASVPVDPPVDLDTVRVGPSVTVVEIAAAAEVPVESVKKLNPQLLAGRTPPTRAKRKKTARKSWVVRLPKGKGVAAHQRLAKTGSPKNLEPYVVRFGDTVRTIAAERKSKPSRIRSLNGVSRRERLEAGTVLLVPRLGPGVAPGKLAADDVAVVPPRRFTYPQRRRVFYRVLKGDSSTSIARAFGVSKTELATWNSLDPTARLVSGMVLQLYVPKGTDLSRVRFIGERSARVLIAGSDAFFDYFEALKGRKRITVRARRGDTLRKIGKRYGLSVGNMERINRLSRREKLRPGDEIVVYAKRGDAPVVAGATKSKVAPLPAVKPPRPELLPGT